MPLKEFGIYIALILLFYIEIWKGIYIYTSIYNILIYVNNFNFSLNLLLDNALNTKLADFGWTRTMANYMTSKIGTYQWMAPEVIGG